MPVIPSFGRYAEAPDLAGAYLGARRADIAGFEALTQWELGQRRIAQEAAESQARIALGYETLEARKVENEMELAAKQATEQREHLRRQQEAQIQKSYRDTQLDMAKRRLAIAEAEEAQRIKDAATAFDQQQYFSKRFSELMSQPNMTSEKAASQAVLEMGPKAGGFASALSGPREFEARSERERKMQEQYQRRFPELMQEPGMTAEKAAAQAALEMGPGTPGFASALTPPREPVERMGEVEKLRLTSSLQQIDSEMAEQRRLLNEADKQIFKPNIKDAEKGRLLDEKARIMGRLNTLTKKRNELLGSATNAPLQTPGTNRVRVLSITPNTPK